MSFPLIIRPEAEADLTEAFQWYENRQLGLGLEFLEQVAIVYGRLEENPSRHPVVYRNVRRALVRRFPYKVFYFFENESIQIIGVVHARRHPEFWQKRARR